MNNYNAYYQHFFCGKIDASMRKTDEIIDVFLIYFTTQLAAHIYTQNI